MTTVEKVSINLIDFDEKVLKLIEEKAYTTDLIRDIGVTQEQYERRMKYYFSIPQPEQKSQAWLDQRYNYITASAFGTTLVSKWNVARTDLLKEKVSKGAYRTFFGNEATRWGEKYEDVANAVYCYRMGVQVEEYGLIPHYREDINFFGASTDGISTKLINLEIKCPFSRVIKPGTVKPIYEKQMQLQMSVLDLPLTHFLECKFEEYRTEEDFWIDFDYPLEHPEKGIIIELVDYHCTNLAGEPKMVYEYSPIEYCNQRAKLQLWHKKKIYEILASNHKVYIRSHFWYLKVCSCINVPRKRSWFEEQIPLAKEFWNEVLHYRVNGGIEQIDADYAAHQEEIRLQNLSPEPSPTPFIRPLGRCLLGDDSDPSEDPAEKPIAPVLRLNTAPAKTGCLIGDDSESEPEPEPESVPEAKPETSSPKGKFTLKLTYSDRSHSSETDTSSTGSIFPDEDLDDFAEEEAETSGSDEEGDSPPMRPPNPKVGYYRKKKK